MSVLSEISEYMHKNLSYLNKNTPSSNAACSRLLAAAGKKPQDSPEVWDVTLRHAPDNWDSFKGIPSAAENATHAALTLYATHRQSKGHSMHCNDISFGDAVRKLGQDDATVRRFNAVVTAPEFTGVIYHIRGLIQLMRAKGIKMDYALFAQDLYLIQHRDYAGRVRLRWGEDFYKIDNKKGDK